MVFQNNVLGGASNSGTSGFSVDQSIRFNPADSAYMHKTFSGAGNKKTFTISLWLKRSLLGSRQDFWSYAQDVPLLFQADDTLKVALFGVISLVTNRVFRDPSAWMHICLTVDSSQAVARDRIKLNINGQRETSFSTENYPSLNADASVWTSTTELQLFKIIGGTNYFGGYGAEIVLLDGTATDASSFGEFKEDSDIWIPKDVSTLTFGTNGFWIDGRDSGDLGDDESGRGNDFSTSGLAAHDQMTGESPTNNFAVFNPLLTNNSVFEYTEGNLKMDFNTNASWDHASGGSISMDSGKWYWEAYWTTGDSYSMFGILPTELIHMCAGSGSNVYLSGNFIQNRSGGSIIDLYRQVQGSTTTAGDFQVTNYLQFALDMDNKKFWCGVNGTYFSSGNPGAGSNELFTSTDVVSDSYTPAFLGYDISADTIIQLNFGQDSTFAGVVTAGGNSDGNGIGNFKYAVPSGFKALCTKNLGS